MSVFSEGGGPKHLQRLAREGSPRPRVGRAIPTIDAALAMARARFAAIPGVAGIGLGRAYSESRGRYQPSRAGKSALCVKVLVARKRKPRRHPARSAHPAVVAREAPRIPQIGPGALRRGRPRRASPRRGRGVARNSGFQYGHGWPTASVVCPGRLFVFAHSTGGAPRGSSRPTIAKVATTAVMVRLHSNGLPVRDHRGGTPSPTLAIVASRSPTRILPWGRMAPDWTPVARSAVLPALDRHGVVRARRGPLRNTNQMAAARRGAPLANEVPPRARHPEDRAAAIEAEDDSGLLLVERRAPNGASRLPRAPGGPRRGLPDFLADACQNGAAPMAFALTWRLRFTRATSATPDAFVTSIAGDSGAPCTIRAIDRPGFFRILGIHFLELKDSAHGGWMSYAMDAVSFFRECCTQSREWIATFSCEARGLTVGRGAAAIRAIVRQTPKPTSDLLSAVRGGRRSDHAATALRDPGLPSGGAGGAGVLRVGLGSPNIGLGPVLGGIAGACKRCGKCGERFRWDPSPGQR